MKKVIEFILLQNAVNKQIETFGKAKEEDANRLEIVGDSLSLDEIDTVDKYYDKKLIIAILIDAANKCCKYVLIEPKLESYYKLIGNGCNLIEAAYPFKSKNHVYVDEEGFLKRNEVVYYKDLGAYLAGNAIVLGSDKEGNDLSTTLTIEQVTNRITFIYR